MATGDLSLIGERPLKARRNPKPCASALGAKAGAASSRGKSFSDRVRGLGQR